MLEPVQQTKLPTFIILYPEFTLEKLATDIYKKNFH